jgi:cyclic beta-1,2-glucan synthetase
MVQGSAAETGAVQHLSALVRRAFGPRRAVAPWDSEELIRAELFSVERLEQHGRSLAAAQRISAEPIVRRSLGGRLRDDEAILLAAYRTIAAAVAESHPITPAAEWLLDNYHLVEEQIREIREDLPPSFYRLLPKLDGEPFRGYPRVLGVAWAFVAHTDSRFDPESLRRFVRAYQQVEPLTIGELWAVAITLRIVLVENLRRAAASIVGNRAARQDADGVANRLLGVAGAAAEPDALTRRAANGADLSPAFMVQMVQRLRDQDPNVTPALLWLEQRLAAQGTTAELIVRDELQKQGATNVTVRNIITSMRLMSDLDWAELFESVSLVDEALRSGSDFGAMDFATRNLYRAAIEQLARGSRHSELAVAQAALAAAAEGPRGAAAAPDRTADPGYHLIAEGRYAFEASLGFRATVWSWPRRFGLRTGVGGYAIVIGLLSLVVLSWPLLLLDGRGMSALTLTLLALVGWLPALDAALALVNRAAAKSVGATILPAMALRAGIPMNLRTLVVVPALLTTRAALDIQIDRLEVHYLASPDGELYFALLSDWADAPFETLVSDQALLGDAAQGILHLNQRYGSPQRPQPFLLLHRRRVWSEGQRQWMGWERKRGKLHEVNRLLRGATDTTFIGANGQAPAVPTGIRFVITLDADTRLPRDCARRLVGKMAHPLNQPRFDAATGQVVHGYAVLQPRVAPSLPTGREGSRFQRIFSSAGGIDPYSAAASDVYQDLFGEGSYAGKGIYDVNAFEAALGGRVLDNSLLSHDLFEGIFARAGLVSDIQVVEEFPARYDVAAARQHRWARGDWQLLPWLLGRKDAAAGARGSGRVPLIGQWKMLDNLRRTATAPASLAALLVGWTLPWPAALIWTAFIVISIALPALIPMLAAIVPRRAGISIRSHLYALRGDAVLAANQTAYLITFLAHQAWLMTDAVLRTLYRLFVSRRNLLQWVTAAQANLTPRLEFAGAYRHMRGGVLVAFAALGIVAELQTGAGWVAAPFIVLWLAAPALAVWISVSPLVAGRVPVSAADARALRRVARQTWRYFETFVTADDIMLPPDNFQEDPQAVVAHRTSPTNIGLYLLAAVSAHDFGWAGTLDTVERLEAAMATMSGLQRFRGHFYNWYDTRDRRPLEPRYVSSVDSGNLAAHLLALANSCREWLGEAMPLSAAVAGTLDAVALAREALARLPDERRMQIAMREQLTGAFEAFAGTLAAADASLMEASAATLVDIARTFISDLGNDADTDLLFWAEAAQRSIRGWQRDANLSDDGRRALQRRLAAIEATSRAMADAMEFAFLLDPERRLLSIGYRADEGTLDPNCYDLLASEARLASFVAIAKNEVPAKHWFRLGRAVSPWGPGAALISWSGSMFEYLMPSLVLRAPTGSLLDQTNRLVVGRQIGYGAELGVPWGMSESAYNARDLEFTYQYSNFGVPGLGLKRGLSQSTVIAPYATALAAMVDPAAAVRNFAHLQAIGAAGRFGFYEALDFTRSRVPDGAKFAVVRAFMAHHQGMTLVALANVLFDGKMRDRFHTEPIVQATELLLQERTPRDVSVSHPRAEEVTTAARIDGGGAADVRRLHTPHDAVPQVHLLSNGRYAVMLTAAGSGYSRWGELAITRWREDATRDDFGSYFYLRDVDSGTVWSAGYQPTGVEPDRYEVTFTEDRAEYMRIDDGLTTTLEVLVSPEDDAEVRRVSMTNTGNRDRDIDITAYAELVLAPAAADVAHPAFSKLFVQTEYAAKEGVLLATRRRRTATEAEVWAAHQAVVEGELLRAPEFETDRARFLGRGSELREPIAVCDGRPLSNTLGTVLDPVFASRHRLRVPAGGTARIAYWTGVAASRQGVLDLLDKHHEASAFVRAGTLAWTQAQVQLRHLGIEAAEANLFQRLASHVLLANASMRSSSDAIVRGGGPPAALWAQGISGDLPIVLVRIADVEEIDIARQLLRAHEYWRLKLLAVDLVILNERSHSYVQDLQNALETQVRMSQSSPPLAADHTRGSVFVLRTDLISEQTRGLLSSVARVVLSGQRGTLAEQLDRHREAEMTGPQLIRKARPAAVSAATVAAPPLEFYNGLGGFGDDGREYMTILEPGRSTPAPWINVIANPRFGFQVSTEGCGYTWSRNSRDNQLTPWSNDPVADPPGEALYVCDEETGEVWGPTALPVRQARSTYTARHGQGYSRFEHTAYAIESELLQYVPLGDSVKISRLRIHNVSGRVRRLSVTAYAEWVLGQSRSASAPFVATQTDAVTSALFARNSWSASAGSHVAFADLCGAQTSWTCDRREFLGRHGSLRNPAALATRALLSKRVGAGLDPCAALQTLLRLEPDQSVEVVWLLGEAADAELARALITRYRTADLDAVLEAVHAHWDDVLDGVRVKTPDRSWDIMQNRWLLYQTLVCRMWARSGLYQASGAYGFRDQLQDSMALTTSKPALAREHLLRAAGRQFVEGDVQHWWLPQTGQGVRTRISDDRVWLAYVAAHYVRVTGDRAVFDEKLPFLEGQALRTGEHDAYFQPVIADETANLYEHCARALDHCLEVGAHGLPLMGTGDWNDGMNCVGEGGKGESIWLGWFLHTALLEFAPCAAARGEHDRAAGWLSHATALQAALELAGWDGDWYRRAYFDDGTPLGSAGEAECRIDSIAQSWAVLSGAAEPERAEHAMSAVEAQLIRRDSGLALLFTPPFDHTALNPGYIKGYPPGIRENGGQYTHAALWSVMAFAKLGQGTKAAALLAMLNPINHTATRADVHRYKVEPYVVVADIYSVAPHIGRGGWTWYTGSAGWMYRAGLESILGFRLRGNDLLLAPCVPEHWPKAEIWFKYRSARYEILIDNPQGVSHGIINVDLDGVSQPGGAGTLRVADGGAITLRLADDGAVHHVRLLLGRLKGLI